MRTLTFSTLYPNSVQPHHGIFVETRLRHLLRDCDVSTRVVAPVPWFPSKHPRFGSYADFARVPGRETLNGIDIEHPRYLVIPKAGMLITPYLLALAARPSVRRILEDGDGFDLIDAHYFYPDGVAAAMLSRWCGKPLVITARGTDVNLIPELAIPRRQILWAAGVASRAITVAAALRDDLTRIGVPAEKVTVLRNGVDLERFHPVDRESARADLGISGTTVLSVGHLIPRKGHELVVEAVARLPGVSLIIIGTGPEQARLNRDIERLGLGDRVRFTGRIEQVELKRYYSAADALVLASSREGWANVLLESMACGTPVVATDANGTPEVVNCRAAGVLIHERSGTAIAEGLTQLFAAPPAREETAAYARQFTWKDISLGQFEVFQSALGDGTPA